MSADPSSTALGGVLWRMAPMIYGPTILFALGVGAVLPVLPVLAVDLGAGVATAALVASALVVGQLLGNLPAGWAVAQVGERIAMTVAGVLAMIGVVGLALAPSLWLLTGSTFLIGLCSAVFGLARHSFMTTRVPIAFRARALSLLGGTFRFGMFIGPFAAAALIAIFDDEQAAVWFCAICFVLMIALVVFGTDPEELLAPSGHVTAASGGADDVGPDSIATRQSDGVFATMVRHREVLARLGAAAACMSAVRSARQVALPLWGVSIGLDAGTTALIVGISGAIDFALFYASGQVMDRFGRLWAALPAMILMAAGFVALSVTHDLDRSALWFAVSAAVLGVGNGLSSGILLTIGADVAPQANPAPFLGSWRTLADAGGAVAPLAIAGITAVAALPLAVAAMGGIGLVGAAAFLRFVPRYVPLP